MLRARFGDDFLTRIGGNLEVKTNEVQKKFTKGKRGDKREKPQRAQREKKAEKGEQNNEQPK